MTLLEELNCAVPELVSSSRRVESVRPVFRLAFNGELSADELRMAEQGTFEE